MADDEEPSTRPTPPPCVVEYDAVTGVPAEFNEFLPKDSDEYKRWKAMETGGVEALEALTFKEKPEEGGEEGEKPEGAVKKKGGKPAKLVLIEQNARQRSKCVTSVAGLEHFGIKLSDASKIMGKKFACGASVVKTPSLVDQIEMQGAYLRSAPDVLIKNFGKSHGLGQEHIFYVKGKKKLNFYEDAPSDDD
ncbi:hypothetical protein FOA52_004909 [Chlamydomonas sp. UWO 241]|nr:hypothetical protein FOA52_004909 [Chlamydomonas sp. UWO 241]